MKRSSWPYKHSQTPPKPGQDTVQEEERAERQKCSFTKLRVGRAEDKARFDEAAGTEGIANFSTAALLEGDGERRTARRRGERTVSHGSGGTLRPASRAGSTRGRPNEYEI